MPLNGAIRDDIQFNFYGWCDIHLHHFKHLLTWVTVAKWFRRKFISFSSSLFPHRLTHSVFVPHSIRIRNILPQTNSRLVYKTFRHLYRLLIFNQSCCFYSTENFRQFGCMSLHYAPRCLSLSSVHFYAVHSFDSLSLFLSLCRMCTESSSF